jgi:hypothetical protein
VSRGTALKGRSLHKLLSEFNILALLGVNTCGRGGYLVVSSGKLTDGVWMVHIKN